MDGKLVKFSSAIDRLGGLTIGIDGAPLMKPEWWREICEYDQARLRGAILRYLAGLGWEPPVVFPRTWDDIARWNGAEREHIWTDGAGIVDPGLPTSAGDMSAERR